ncbi:monocopper oxidase-like protein SKU5 [Tanacetum coccineum]
MPIVAVTTYAVTISRNHHGLLCFVGFGGISGGLGDRSGRFGVVLVVSVVDVVFTILFKERVVACEVGRGGARLVSGGAREPPWTSKIFRNDMHQKLGPALEIHREPPCYELSELAQLATKDILGYCAYVTRNGIQQRLNSWQDDVTRTNCAIQPDTNWTYAFVVKDQIGTFTYFPSINYQKLAGGFDPIRVNNRVVISVSFPKPEAEFDLLIGDWYFTDYKVDLDILYQLIKDDESEE